MAEPASPTAGSDGRARRRRTTRSRSTAPTCRSARAPGARLERSAGEPAREPPLLVRAARPARGQRRAHRDDLARDRAPLRAVGRRQWPRAARRARATRRRSRLSPPRAGRSPRGGELQPRSRPSCEAAVVGRRTPSSGCVWLREREHSSPRPSRSRRGRSPPSSRACGHRAGHGNARACCGQRLGGGGEAHGALAAARLQRQVAAGRSSSCAPTSRFDADQTSGSRALAADLAGAGASSSAAGRERVDEQSRRRSGRSPATRSPRLSDEHARPRASRGSRPSSPARTARCSGGPARTAVTVEGSHGALAPSAALQPVAAAIVHDHRAVVGDDERRGATVVTLQLGQPPLGALQLLFPPGRRPSDGELGRLASFARSRGARAPLVGAGPRRSASSSSAAGAPRGRRRGDLAPLARAHARDGARAARGAARRRIASRSTSSGGTGATPRTRRAAHGRRARPRRARTSRSRAGCSSSRSGRWRGRGVVRGRGRRLASRGSTTSRAHGGGGRARDRVIALPLVVDGAADRPARRLPAPAARADAERGRRCWSRSRPSWPSPSRTPGCTSEATRSRRRARARARLRARGQARGSRRSTRSRARSPRASRELRRLEHARRARAVDRHAARGRRGGDPHAGRARRRASSRARSTSTTSGSTRRRARS